LGDLAYLPAAGIRCLERLGYRHGNAPKKKPRDAGGLRWPPDISSDNPTQYRIVEFI